MNSVRAIIISILPRLSDQGLQELQRAIERHVENRLRWAEIHRAEILEEIRRRAA